MTAVDAPLRAPFTACLWVTDYCNLDCVYCYAKPFSGRRMESPRMLELVGEFLELGVFDITFAGGEPMLHPNILSAVDKCVEAGMRVGLLSNGVALSEYMIGALEESTTNKDFIIQISLDSTDPVINDTTRGKTEQVITNLNRLCETTLDIQLACVIHKRNIHNAHRMIEQYYPRIKRFHFLNMQRTSSSLIHPNLLLDEEETLDFWLHLNEYAKGFPDDLMLPSLRIQMRALGHPDVDPHSSLHQNASFNCGACSAGWTHVNITADFDVLGCDIAKEYTLMGNCTDISFEKVWRSEAAERIRNLPYPACYKISGPDGAKLEDHLKPEFMAQPW